MQTIHSGLNWKVPYHAPVVDDAIIDAFARVMRSGCIHRGPDTDAFERELARYIGVSYGVATSSGTAALQLMWESLEYGSGSEVIMQANGYISDATAAMHAGLTPVFVDPDEETLQLAPERVRRAITPKTRAVVVVHMYGHPSDMDALAGICKSQGLDVIEVLAHATGAEYRGRKIGSFGRATMSTFGNKMLNVYGLGGIVLTNDTRLAADVASLRKNVPDPGSDYYHMERLPYNYQLSEPQAAVGRLNLARLDGEIERRRHNARRLTTMFEEAEIPVRLPIERPWARHCYLHFVIRTPRRDALRAYLAGHGIDARIHYDCPLYLVGPIRRRFGYTAGDFPVADEVCRTILSLPVNPGLEDSQIGYMVEKVIEYFRNQA